MKEINLTGWIVLALLLTPFLAWSLEDWAVAVGVVVAMLALVHWFWKPYP